MSIDLVKIGNFLCEQRNKIGLTQEQLAVKVGVSYKTISKWECGNSFPDVSYQLLLCNALGITLKELQMGCFDIKERVNKKLLIIFSRVSIVLFIIFTPLFIALTIYFASHYNKMRIYQIQEYDESEKNCKISGVLVESYKNNYLFISNIGLYEYNATDKDIISIDLYSNEKSIYHKNTIESFALKYENSNYIDKNNLKLVIDIKQSDGQTYSYSTKLVVYDSIQSISINNHNGKGNLDSKKYNLYKSLEQDGFINNNEFWIKQTYTGESEITIIYYPFNDKIMYSNRSLETWGVFTYFKQYNMLEASIYSSPDLKVIIEKYIYYYNNDELECQVGVCASKRKVLDVMEKYVTLLNSD